MRAGVERPVTFPDIWLTRTPRRHSAHDEAQRGQQRDAGGRSDWPASRQPEHGGLDARTASDVGEENACGGREESCGAGEQSHIEQQHGSPDENCVDVESADVGKEPRISACDRVQLNTSPGLTSSKTRSTSALRRRMAAVRLGKASSRTVGAMYA